MGLDHIDRNILADASLRSLQAARPGWIRWRRPSGRMRERWRRCMNRTSSRTADLNRTPRGRAVTALAYQRLGLPAPEQA